MVHCVKIFKILSLKIFSTFSNVTARQVIEELQRRKDDGEENFAEAVENKFKKIMGKLNFEEKSIENQLKIEENQ